MHTIKVIISWISFYSLALMFALFLYSLARVGFALAEYWRARACTERKKTNIAGD